MSENNLTVADEGSKVVLVYNGRRVCDMPPEIAQQVSRLLYQKAMVADEYRDANRIVMDQAIMQRAGMPFGLSNNRKIVDEARKEAQWNTKLRKSMPMKGIEAHSIVGTPTLVRTPRKVSNG